MTAFAEVSDLEARWRPLSTAEQATAGALLDDASVIIRAEVAGADEIAPEITRLVACAMVKRAMVTSNVEGFSQVQNTAGPFQHGGTLANPMGNLYLSKQDRKILGSSGQVAFSIDLGSYDDAEVTPLNWWELNL